MFSKILVPLDGSEVAEEVLPYVEELCKGHKHQVVLLRIGEITEDYAGTDPDYRIYVEQAEERVKRRLMEYLETIEQQLQDKGIRVRSEAMLVDSARTAEGIISCAKRNGIKIIAMTTHGRSGIGRWVYGSIADKVLRGATVPVLLVRSKGAKTRAALA